MATTTTLIGKHAAIRQLWRAYRKCIREAVWDTRHGFDVLARNDVARAEQFRTMAEDLEREILETR